MPVLSNKPVISKFQVGEFVYFSSNNKVFYSKIVSINTEVSNPLNNNNGVQINQYYFDDFSRPVPESSISDNPGLYIKKFTGQYVKDFTGVNFGNADLKNLDLSCCKFNNANLESVDFENADVRSSDFSGASLPIDISSKTSLKDYVGVGNYDDDTLWTDGTSVNDSN